MIKPCQHIIDKSWRGLFYFILVVSLPIITYGQTHFQRLYARNDTVGPSGIGAIAQLSNGGYLMTGSIYPCFNCTLSVALAIRTDYAGDTLWTRRLGGARDDGFVKVIQTYDGNYLLAGQTMSFGPQPMGGSNLYGEYIYLVKLDPNGDTLWTKIYGGTNTDYYNNNYLSDIRETSDSGFILSAEISDVTNSGRSDALLIRLNSSGDTLWTKAYGSSNWEIFGGVEETPDGGFIVAGDTAWNQGLLYTNEGVVLKIDSAGNLQWQKTYGGSQLDALSAVKRLSNGDFIVAGNTNSFTSDSTKSYIYILRLNSIGDTLWTKIYGPVFNFRYLNLVNDSVALITGLSGTTHYGILALKISTLDGSILSKKEYGSPGAVDGVALTSDGGFIFGTSSPDFGSSYGEGYVIKVDSNGNSGCYEYALGMNSYSTQTNVGVGHLKIKPFPVLVQGTNTQVGSGIKLGTVCTNVGIPEENDEEGLVIFPNPVSKVLYVESTEKVKFEIMNSIGEAIYSSAEPLNNNNILMDDFPNGIYLIKIFSSCRTTISKFIVQH